ncbi:hypothetical protein Hanom_Chr11g01031881 [Helianthus anomalus]
MFVFIHLTLTGHESVLLRFLVPRQSSCHLFPLLPPPLKSKTRNKIKKKYSHLYFIFPFILCNTDQIST